jgi:cold shock CspA family protein
MIGTVRLFNLQKGYGFIHADDGSFNIFVDKSAVERAGMSDLKEVSGSFLRVNGTSAPAICPPCR